MISQETKQFVSMVNSLCKELPKVLEYHKKMFRTFSGSSHFFLTKKKSIYSTELTANHIMLFHEGAGVLRIDLCDYHMYDSYVYPGYDEILLTKGETGFVLGVEPNGDDLYGTYNFKTKVMTINDDSNRSFELLKKKDYEEMMFLLSLETITENHEDVWTLIKSATKMISLPGLEDAAIELIGMLSKSHNFKNKFSLPE